MNGIIKHPGTVLSDDVLNGLKRYKEGIEKMKTDKWEGCRCMECVDIGPYGAGKGHKEFTEDTAQTYKFVLLWLATEDDMYAKRAGDIIKTWCSGCKVFKGSNAPLEMAWGSVMVRSAELLKYKWKEWKSIEKCFEEFLNGVMLPVLLGRYAEIKKWNNNWILALIEALMQVYIYKNDFKKFIFYVEEYKALRDGLFIGNTGKNNECERDIIHASFQVLSHLNICEIAFHQGINLWNEKIRKSCEYVASIINGEKPNDMIKIKDPWYMPANWEYAVKYFKNMPQVEMMLNQKKRRPEGSTFCWGPGWTHQV